MSMSVGTRVRHSGHVTQQKRDYWCSLGDYTRKSQAKAALDACIAERGTIVEVLHNGYRVQWDDGHESQCLSYLVTEAPEAIGRQILEAATDDPMETIRNIRGQARREARRRVRNGSGTTND